MTGAYDIRILGGYSGDGYTGNQAWIVTGNGNDLKLMVDSASGILRQSGVYIKSGTGNNRGNVGVRTANPSMSLEVRGSGIKIGPHLFDGDSLQGATSWDRTPQHGMFIGGMFNASRPNYYRYWHDHATISIPRHPKCSLHGGFGQGHNHQGNKNSSCI
jgi:hypothetical protein